MTPSLAARITTIANTPSPEALAELRVIAVQVRLLERFLDELAGDAFDDDRLSHVEARRRALRVIGQ